MVRCVARDHSEIRLERDGIGHRKAKATVRLFEVARRVMQVRKMSDFQVASSNGKAAIGVTPKRLHG
jgi:hypothetical protein